MRPSLRDQLQQVRDAVGPRRRWCDGKIAHRSRGKAKAHARSLNRLHARERDEGKKTDKSDGKAVEYQCKTCLAWHVGNVTDATEGGVE
jgi:hypothetical protein